MFDFRRFRLHRELPTTARAPRCDSCPLGVCDAGVHATVVCITCPAHDAQRLRSLGVFEGARVHVVDTRSGMVLDVRGSRLAFGWDVVAAITVCPIAT